MAENPQYAGVGRRLGGFFDFWPLPGPAPLAARNLPTPVPERHIMSGSALYETFARAPLRLRARRGQLAGHRRRRALSRFRRRHRRQFARPRPSASRRGADRAGRQALARLQPLRDPGPAPARPSGWSTRPSPTRCSSPIPAPRRWNARSRRRAAISMSTAIRSASASSPSRAPSTAARWRPSPPAARRNISKASAPRSTASTRCRSATSTPPRRRSRPRPPPS